MEELKLMDESIRTCSEIGIISRLNEVVTPYRLAQLLFKGKVSHQRKSDSHPSRNPPIAEVSLCSSTNDWPPIRDGANLLQLHHLSSDLELK